MKMAGMTLKGQDNLVSIMVPLAQFSGRHLNARLLSVIQKGLGFVSEKGF